MRRQTSRRPRRGGPGRGRRDRRVWPPCARPRRRRRRDVHCVSLAAQTHLERRREVDLVFHDRAGARVPSAGWAPMVADRPDKAPPAAVDVALAAVRCRFEWPTGHPPPGAASATTCDPTPAARTVVSARRSQTRGRSAGSAESRSRSATQGAGVASGVERRRRLTSIAADPLVREPERRPGPPPRSVGPAPPRPGC